MPKLYKIADAMLVTLEDKPYENMTIPGKVQSYMAVGKPIIGSINGSCSEFITTNEIGYCCETKDYEKLANIIKSLKYKNLVEIGKIAQQIYFDKYSKASFISKLQSELEKYI